MDHVVVQLDNILFGEPVRVPGGTNSIGGSGETWFTRTAKFEMYYHVTLQLVEIRRGKGVRWVHASRMLECTPILESAANDNGIEPTPKEKRLANLEKARMARALKFAKVAKDEPPPKLVERSPRNFTREDMGLPPVPEAPANTNAWRGLSQMGRPQ